MTDNHNHIRHGFGAVRPYIYGHLGLEDLLKQAFGGVEIERHEFSPTHFHIELQVGDSVVVLEVGDPIPEGVTPGSVYIYVPDVDAAYRRALEWGARSFSEPGDRPYQERNAGVKDSFGNTWFISTYTGE